MSKLYYMIGYAKEGANVIDKSEKYKRYARDARSFVQEFKQISGSKDPIAEYLTFGGDVAIINIVCPLQGGRPSDYKSVMIVVPADVAVEGAELEKLAGQAKDVLQKASDLKEMQAELDDIFSKEDYQKKELPSRVRKSPSAEDKWAFRKIGRHTESEIFEKLFQRYYYNYKAIFLIDKVSPSVPSDAYDLTKNELETEVVLRSPENLDARLEVSINGKPFAGESYFIKGEKIKVVYNRKPFEPITETLTLNETINKIESGKGFTWELRVTRNYFVIRDKRTKAELKNAKVYIDGIEVNGLNKFSESSLASVEFKVTCDGYHDYSSQGKVNLLNGKPEKVELTKLPKKVEYEIVGAKVPSPVKFTIDDVKELGDNDSPIDGYRVVSHRQNKGGAVPLVFDDRSALPFGELWSRSSFKAKIVAIVVSLCAIMGVALAALQIYEAVKPEVVRILGWETNVTTSGATANEQKPAHPATGGNAPASGDSANANNRDANLERGGGEPGESKTGPEDQDNQPGGKNEEKEESPRDGVTSNSDSIQSQK